MLPKRFCHDHLEETNDPTVGAVTSSACSPTDGPVLIEETF